MYKDWGDLKKICSKYGVQTYFKGSATIKQLPVRTKDQDPKDHKSNVIYSYQCGKVDWDEEYLGKTSRTLGERYKEHLKKLSRTYTQPPNRAQHQPRKLQHIRQGGPGPNQVNQRINLHQGQQPHP